MSEHINDVPALEVEGVTKQFPGVLANDNVSLTLRRGEILALLGENGAGKSTLMNIIYGLYHPDGGTIRLKGRTVHFASPREAIHSGIGMVHQHFQLVNVMTVAENVVLGEESTVAYQGESHRTAALVLKWLPSLMIFAICFVIGLSLGSVKYALGGAAFGVINGVAVAVLPVGRLLWAMTWRVGLALVAVAIAGQIERVAQVGLTALALQRSVETVYVERPQVMDSGYTVKAATVSHAKIAFDWSSEGRKASDAGTGVDGVLASAREQIAVYRDNGVPGWMIDAIDNAPPVVYALSVALLLFLFGAHTLVSWRGIAARPEPARQGDVVALGVLIVIYGAGLWFNTTDSALWGRAVLLALLVVGLGVAARRTVRARPQTAVLGRVSPLDGAFDAFLVALYAATEIRNVRAAGERVAELSRQYGLEVDPDAVIEKLPVGMQQRVEIIKALYRHADILILDEPTAVLTPQEGRELFKIMRELAAQGVSIIFITHKLKEVFEVASQIVVMRGGRVVGATTPDAATETSLATMMVGREVILQVEKGEAQPGGPVLDVRDLSAMDNRGAQALKGVSFDVSAGEVLGIAGVQGNGQTELVEALTGLRVPQGGSVKLLGVDLQPERQPAAPPRTRIAALVLDTLIVAVLSYFIGYFVWYFRDNSLGVSGAALTVVIVDALYFLGSWLATGATIGLALFGLAITNRDDSPAPALRLFQRYVIVLALRLPALIPLIVAQLRADEDQTAWFDRWLGLRVIRRAHITPRHIKDIGSSHVPEDRQRHGMVKLYSVADNLVLNDYYERPYASEPNLAELPGALLRYLVVMGVIIAALTAAGLYVWNHGLWTALLDAYNVPPDLRTMGRSLTRVQKNVLQYPIIIAVLTLLATEIIFAGIAHVITMRLLGWHPVRRAIIRQRELLRRTLSRAQGRAGEPSAPQGGLLRNQAAIDQHATALIEQFDIRTPSSSIEGGNLSGGNQQKMIVAREFSRKPRLLIAAQPTRGIDVGSIEFIHQQIIEQRDAGAAVLLVSAELDEIMALSDRIAVIYKGEIIDTLDAKAASREQIGLLMAGIASA